MTLSHMCTQQFCSSNPADMALPCCLCVAMAEGPGVAIDVCTCQCMFFGLAGSDRWRNPAQCRACDSTRRQSTPRKAQPEVLMLCASVKAFTNIPRNVLMLISSIMKGESILQDEWSSMLQHCC